MSAVAMNQDTDSATSNPKDLDTAATNPESKAEEGIKELSISPSTNSNGSNTSNQENVSPDSDEKEAGSSEESGSESESEEESSDEESGDLYEGLSKEQIATLKAAMAGVKDDYESHVEKERQALINETKDAIKFNLSIIVSDEEAFFIGTFVNENNVNLEEYLQDEGIDFLAQMKEMMDQAKLGAGQSNSNHSDNDEEYQFPDSDDGDEDWVQNEKKKKAKRAAKSTRGTGKNIDGTNRCGRLMLNDALKQNNQDGWSDARKGAYKNRREKPNAYFYRFNVPGQPQKNGKWDKEDHALFMKRVKEMGSNDSWGIFSKKIPGRVGYQCSNYWRQLIKEGDVKDQNYFYDEEKNKLHLKRPPKGSKFKIDKDYRMFCFTVVKDKSKVWTDLPAKHPKHPSDAYCREVSEALKGNVYGSTGGKKRKRKGGNDSDEDWDSKPTKRRRKTRKKYTDDDGDEAFHCSVSAPEKVVDDDNPMPDHIDIMTGESVVKPAISPYGHVLGYDTWTMLLRTSKAKNLCPFTMQKMTRRSLVKLTKANYDEHKEKIVNITEDQKKLMSQISG